MIPSYFNRLCLKAVAGEDFLLPNGPGLGVVRGHPRHHPLLGDATDYIAAKPKAAGE
jgi:hypothetical protein